MSTISANRQYQVDEIVQCKVDPTTGEKMYLIKWTGYDEIYNTWEPEDYLNCPELVERFEKAAKLKTLTLEIQPDTLEEVQQLPLGSDAKKVLKRYLNNEQARYDFYKDLEPDEIIGITYITGEARLLIKWKGHDKHDIVPFEKAKSRFPDAVLAFFEQQVKKSEEEEDF